MNTCKSCHAPIRWAYTDKGRRLPLDPEANAEGNLILQSTPVGDKAFVLSGSTLDRAKAQGTELFITHFSTCPNAKRHRRPR